MVSAGCWLKWEGLKCPKLMKTLEDLSIRITWFNSPRGPTCLNRSECRVLLQHLPWWSLAGFPTQMIECCCSVRVCMSENCLTFNLLQIFRFCSGHKCLHILPKAVLWWEDGWVRGNVLWLVWIGTSWKQDPQWVYMFQILFIYLHALVFLCWVAQYPRPRVDKAAVEGRGVHGLFYWPGCAFSDCPE